MTSHVGIHVPLLIHPPSEILHSRPLRVDLNVLCDLAERLSGLFIMAERFNSLRGVLHGVTLPQSWLVKLILPVLDLKKDTSTLPTFAETLIELMQRIDAQVQHCPTCTSDTEGLLTADGDRMVDFMGPLYIARM